MAIADKNLVELIVQARFGPRKFAGTEQSIYADLSMYGAILEEASMEAVSNTAIHGWVFSPGAKWPKRSKSKRFLNGYLLWMEQKIQLNAEQRRVFEEVTEHLRPFGVPEAKSKIIQSRGRTGLPKESWTEEEVNFDALEYFAALEGTYQILRPSTIDQNSYVLEAMEIRKDVEKRELNILMYSYSQHKPKFIYQGKLVISVRYAFALLERMHELSYDRVAARCLSFYLGQKAQQTGYHSHHCLSGLMMLGVTGEVSGTRTMSSPLVAIKVPYNSNMGSVDRFENATFSELKKTFDLYRLYDTSNVLVGRVRKKRENTIFEFCSRIFENLKPYIVDGLIFYTVAPDKVNDAVLSNATDDGDYFAAWQKAIDEFTKASG